MGKDGRVCQGGPEVPRPETFLSLSLSLSLSLCLSFQVLLVYYKRETHGNYLHDERFQNVKLPGMPSHL
jgi:hypothetical protein